MKRLYCLMLAVVSGAALADESAIKLKPGAAETRVASACSVCHSLDYIQMNSPFLDRKGWDATVRKMVKVMGAPLKDDEIPGVVDYLTAQYGVPATTQKR